MSKIQTFILNDEKNLAYKGEESGKKIFVYTPDGYPHGLDVYPVIYAFDGQNLFASCDDYKCEAKAPMLLEEICKKANAPCVIVGVYNGEGEFTRDRQLTMSSSFGTLVDPFNLPGFKEGSLEKTGDFVIETLIPFIEKNYKVSFYREERTVFGASSGGLASLYLGLKYSKVFGNICSLSPATCLFLKSDWERFFKSLNVTERQRILIYCGRNTSDLLESYLYDGLGNCDILSSRFIKPLLYRFVNSRTVIKEVFFDNACHSEEYWRLAVEENIEFLLRN